MNSSKKTSILDTCDAIRRWHNKQNQKHFERITVAPNKWPLPKTHKCVIDDNIKGKLFCIQRQEIHLDISFAFLSPTPNILPAAGTLPTQKYFYTTPEDATESLYYFDRDNGRMGLRKITVSTNEHVIATGKKTISALNGSNELEYYEILTTRGVAFIQKEKLRLIS